MKLTSTVNLVCNFSLALAAKAMNSNLLPGYQHGHLQHGNASIFSSPTNISANASLLLAPFYRNVTAGGAWVLPASPFDLGARAMTCECFDPDGKCCMGSSRAVGPFCIPKNATCCSNTLCETGETCCGDYCCRSGTSCSTDTENPGCCPFGQSCSTNTPPTCIDHSSSNCSSKSPPKQCCPSNLAFCSSKENKGLGCYTSATTVSSTKTVSTLTVDVALRTTSSHHYRGTTTLIETVSVKIASEPSGGGISLEFPATVTLGTDLSGWLIFTSYVFSFPSTIFGKPKSTVVATSTSTSTNPTVTSIPPPLSTSTTTSTSTSTPPSLSSHSTPTPSPPKSTKTTPTTKQSLCFNPLLQTPAPCPSSTSTTSTSTSVSAYPTELIIHSSSPHYRLSKPHSIVLAILVFHLGLGIAIFPIESIIEWVLVLGVGVLLWGPSKEGGEGEDDEKVVCDKEDKMIVSGEGSGSGVKDTDMSNSLRDRDWYRGAEKARWYIE